jgi:hypothetical protein
MSSHHTVSADGLVGEWTGWALWPNPGTWDARGTRVTAVYDDASAATVGPVRADHGMLRLSAACFGCRRRAG